MKRNLKQNFTIKLSLRKHITIKSRLLKTKLRAKFLCYTPILVILVSHKKRYLANLGYDAYRLLEQLHTYN